MNSSYLIKGGKPLKGEVILSGAKNVALKTIIAALMFKGDVILKNIPRINDVLELIELIKSLGAKVEFTEKEVVIENIANEPEINDLILYLNSAGAKIREVGTKITIEKCPELNQVEP